MAMIVTPSPLYLASASPRRHEILLQMRVEHRVLHVPAPPGDDEPRLPNESPEHYVERTAREKALRGEAWLAAQEVDGTGGSGNCVGPVLAADTTVILDGEILGKPADEADARSMLTRLSGRKHEVRTAIALAFRESLLEDVSVTQVRFKTLNQDEIMAYCRSGEPMGKAGAYGIQGLAALFIEHISGSYTGVMGLPVYETGRLLARITC